MTLALTRASAQKFAHLICSDLTCFTTLATALRRPHGVVIAQARPLVQRIDRIYEEMDVTLVRILTGAAVRARVFLQIMASLQRPQDREVNPSDLVELNRLLAQRSADLESLHLAVNTKCDQLQTLHSQMLLKADYGQLVTLIKQRDTLREHAAAKQDELESSRILQKECDRQIARLQQQVHVLLARRNRSQARKNALDARTAEIEARRDAASQTNPVIEMLSTVLLRPFIPFVPLIESMPVSLFGSLIRPGPMFILGASVCASIDMQCVEQELRAHHAELSDTREHILRDNESISAKSEELDRYSGRAMAYQRATAILQTQLREFDKQLTSIVAKIDAIFDNSGSRDLEEHRQVTVVCNDVQEGCIILHQVHGQFRSAAEQLDTDTDLLVLSIPAACRFIQFANYYGDRAVAK